MHKHWQETLTPTLIWSLKNTDTIREQCHPNIYQHKDDDAIFAVSLTNTTV